MPNPLTVEEIVPLVEALSPEERARLVRLIAWSLNADPSVYSARPPASDEFSTGDEARAWDSEGWENVASGGVKSAGIRSVIPTNAARF